MNKDTPVLIAGDLYQQVAANAKVNKRSIKMEVEYILEQWFGGKETRGVDTL